MADALPQRSTREFLFTLAIFATVIGSLLLLALATGWQEMLASVTVLTYWQLAILLALSLGNYLLRGLRWLLCNRCIGINVGVFQSLRHYLAGLAMTVTPGRLGELVRLRWIRQETGFPLQKTAPLALVDRAADLAAIGLLLAVSLLFGATSGAAGLPVALMALAVAVLVTRSEIAVWGVTLVWRTIGRWPRSFAKLRHAARALGPFSRPAIILPALALGMIGWYCEGYSFYLLLHWMGADIGLWSAVAIFIISMVTGGATGAPGGLGGAEAAMVALLSLQNVPLDVSIPATAIIRLTTLWFAIFVGTVVFPMATRMAARGSYAT